MQYENHLSVTIRNDASVLGVEPADQTWHVEQLSRAGPERHRQSKLRSCPSISHLVDTYLSSIGSVELHGQHGHHRAILDRLHSISSSSEVRAAPREGEPHRLHFPLRVQNTDYRHCAQLVQTRHSPHPHRSNPGILRDELPSSQTPGDSMGSGNDASERQFIEIHRSSPVRTRPTPRCQPVSFVP